MSDDLLCPNVTVESVQIHEDSRGRLIKAWPHAVTGEVYVVEIRANESRGHHIHHNGAEWFVPLMGTATLVVEDPNTGARRVVRLDGVRARVEPRMAHALFALDGDAWVLAVADCTPEGEQTVPYAVDAP